MHPSILTIHLIKVTLLDQGKIDIIRIYCCFMECDEDGSGKIDKAELRRLIMKLNTVNKKDKIAVAKAALHKKVDKRTIDKVGGLLREVVL
jgi:hypothetical protein